jgi:diguanylate cyclase (GGDEF)-like protein
LASISKTEASAGPILLDGAFNSLSIQTREACRFLLLRRQEFLDFLSKFSRVIPRLFAGMSQQLWNLNERFLCDALERQARFVATERELFRLLAQVPLSATEADNVESALQIVVDRICSCLGWPVGHVYTAEENSPGELFSSPAWHLRTPQQFEMFRRLSDITPFTAGVDLPGKVLASREPLWVEDVTQALNSPRAKIAKQVGLRTGFAVPVLVGDQVVAVLEFFSQKSVRPDHPLMETIAAIATQLGRVMDRKRYEQQLLHNAFHDTLTGLPNRALFLDRLTLSLARVKRNKDYIFAVLFLDLDRFKVINDSLGHLLGDGALAEVAGRLQSVLRATDTVARFGGDEFAILLDDLREMSNVPRTVERIRKELQAPIRLGEREVFTSASIGVVLSSADYTQAEDILQDADIALYHAKAQGRARYIIFDAAMRERAVRLLQIETDLRQAMERGELRLFYQPIVSLDNGRIVGFEALLRWQHPDRGIISAGEFLPIAEETEIILPMSQWILREVCRQLRVWQQEFPSDPPLSVSVNLTTKFLGKPGLVEEISSVIQEHGLDHRSLKLEITESQIMDDPEAISKTLLELRDFGVYVSIDDFGTGYSSLSYLSNFRVQALKIDYSFTSKLNGDDKDAAIVRAVIALGNSLGLDVVAEGVETADQLDFLRAAQCQFAQGYYFCRPVDKESATRLLTEGIRLDRQSAVAISRLRSMDLFERVTDDELSDVAQLARELAVPAGTLVIQQGHLGREVYLLEEGSVEVFRDDTGVPQFVAELRAPGFFGELALLDPDRIRTANVKALTDLRLLAIRMDSFLMLLRRFPALKERIRGVFVERT